MITQAIEVSPGGVGALEMADEKDAFYVVRKGDIVGIYTSFADCQDQLGSSMMSPSVTVYKGYGLGKVAEDHLRSHGLQNSSFSISASEVKEGIFGNLMVCPIQQPPCAKVKAYENDLNIQQKKSQDSIGVGTMKADPFSSFLPSPSLKRSRLDGNSKPILTSSTSNAVRPPSSMNSSMKQGNLASAMDSQTMSSSSKPYFLEFDGASKGNPGLAGAGAVLRSHDGNMVFQLREGVGIATNNVAEYRAVLLGLKYALSKGFKHIRVRGDSKLVCMQVQGLWKCKNPNMAKLCKEVVDLKDKFSSFQIEHVLREYNSEADNQANQAVNLRDGEVQADCITK